MMKGEFAVVDYIGYESTYSDILALDNVRHRNTKCVDCFFIAVIRTNVAWLTVAVLTKIEVLPIL